MSKDAREEGAPKVEAPKVEVKKPSKPTIAKTFQALGLKGAKDRGELADKIIADFKAKGITTNVKGKEIRKERVTQQISAMIRDIKNKRGEKTGAWWSTLEVVETDTELKLVKKAN